MYVTKYNKANFIDVQIGSFLWKLYNIMKGIPLSSGMPFTHIKQEIIS